MKNTAKYILPLVALLAAVACTEYDAYKKYVSGGERIYPQKPEALESFPGRNRVVLQWELIDPNVEHCEVSWVQDREMKIQRVEMPSPRSVDNILKAEIVNLDETNYVFNVTSLDIYGNRSVGAEVEETVFGDLYIATLMSRMAKTVSLSGGNLTITWYGPVATETGIKLTYTSLADGEKTITIPLDELTTVLEGIDTTAPVTYLTMYKPTDDVLDTFYTEAITIEIP